MNKNIQAIKESLDSTCQLCHRKVRRLVLDHDHTTEQARGFVCDECNVHVIPAGERRPELVSHKVLNYLITPPLGHLKVTVKNQLKKVLVYPGESATQASIRRQRERYNGYWTVFNAAHKIIAVYDTVDALKHYDKHKQMNYYPPI